MSVKWINSLSTSAHMQKYRAACNVKMLKALCEESELFARSRHRERRIVALVDRMHELPLRMCWEASMQQAAEDQGYKEILDEVDVQVDWPNRKKRSKRRDT